MIKAPPRRRSAFMPAAREASAQEADSASSPARSFVMSMQAENPAAGWRTIPPPGPAYRRWQCAHQAGLEPRNPGRRPRFANAEYLRRRDAGTGAGLRSAGRLHAPHALPAEDFKGRAFVLPPSAMSARSPTRARRCKPPFAERTFSHPVRLQPRFHRLPARRLSARPGHHLHSRCRTPGASSSRVCRDEPATGLRPHDRRRRRHRAKRARRRSRMRSSVSASIRRSSRRSGEPHAEPMPGPRRRRPRRSFSSPRRDQGGPMSEATLIAVGDVAPDREDPRECFARTRDLLTSADFAFCQLETSLADERRSPAAGAPRRADQAQRRAGHARGRLHRRLLRRQSLPRLGQRRLLRNDRAPQVSRHGCRRRRRQHRRGAQASDPGGQRRHASPSSPTPPSCHRPTGPKRTARAARRCAPTPSTKPIEHDQPGTPARIHTLPHREDLAAMCADIRAAKQQADVVVVSHHWGIHFVPYVLADYQPDVAYAAIDAGADIDPRPPRPHPERRRGLQGQADLLFALQLRHRPAHGRGPRQLEGLPRDPEAGAALGAGLRQPLQLSRRRPHEHRGARRGLRRLAWRRSPSSRSGSTATPCRRRRRSDPRFRQVIDYLETCCRETGRDTRFRINGDAAIIEGVG